MDTRFRVVQRAPSDSLVIVTIDPQSMRALPAWPWPRNYHAQVLDNLFAAGAATVGVNIDFSSRSTDTAEPGPRRRPRPAPRAGGSTPAFLQLESDAGGHPLLRETFPNPLFENTRKSDQWCVHPATDSLVPGNRLMPRCSAFPPIVIGRADLARNSDTNPTQFYLDFGIPIRAAPRLSYVDVLNGTFDPKLVLGKNVLIGATAVELGDQFAVPVYRVLPGPLLQALGYESLVQHRALSRTGALPSFAAAGLILLLLIKLSPG